MIDNFRFRRPNILMGVAIYIAILVFGSIPGLREDIGRLASGLTLHSAAYGFLALLFFLGLIEGPTLRTVFAVSVIALMGAGDELLQTQFPYRHASVDDWVVDVSAALLVSLLLATYQRLRAHGPAPSRRRGPRL